MTRCQVCGGYIVHGVCSGLTVDDLFADMKVRGWATGDGARIMLTRAEVEELCEHGLPDDLFADRDPAQPIRNDARRCMSRRR